MGARLLIGFFFFLFLALGGKESFADNNRSFTLRAGDVVQVTVWKEEGMDREIVVLPDGTITFPLAGTLSVAGLTPAKAQEVIKTALYRSIPDASVSLVVKAPLGHAINVTGQVAKPGEIVMGHSMTVMQALSQAGGLTAFADEDSIRVLRKDEGGTENAIAIPYEAIARGKDLDKNILLIPGDVIVVPTDGLF